MYIRRKVYSVLTDDYGQERLFSTNDIVLDDYEDYYVDDRLFADRERDWTDAAIGGGAGLAGAGALGYGGYKGLELGAKATRVKAAKRGLETLVGAPLENIAGIKLSDIKAARGGDTAKAAEVGKKLQEAFATKGQSVKNLLKDVARARGLKGKMESGAGIIGKIASQYSKEDLEKLANSWEKIKTGGASGKTKSWIDKNIVNKVFKGNKKAALAATLGLGTAAGAGIAYGVGHKKK